MKTAAISSTPSITSLPRGIRALGVDALQYRGVPITVLVGADGLTLTAQSPLAGTLRYRPPEAGTHAVTVTAADGKTFTTTRKPGPDGMIAVDPGETDTVSVVIA